MVIDALLASTEHCLSIYLLSSTRQVADSCACIAAIFMYQ